MRKTLLVLLWIMACVPLGAQTTHRDSVLSHARYLKSIYRTDEAVEELSALVQPGNMDETVLAELADCHFQSGDLEGAAGTYVMLSARVPDNILYKIRLMQIYSRLKAYPQSIEAGQAVLQRDSIPAVVSYIGDSFNNMKQADSALWYYRKSLALRPMNETTLSKAMGILLGAEDFDGALAICQPFLEQDPDNPTIAPLQGLALYRKEAYKDAITVFERQLEMGNDSYPIHFYLGQCFWQTKTLYRAEKEFAAAWQIDSTDVGLAYSIAALKADMYYPFESNIKPWLDKAWEMIQPDAPTASRIQQQYGMGYYRKQNAWDQTIEHYKLAYQYNPKFISALSTIGYCYQMKEDYKQALEWYEKYMKVARPGSNGYKFVEESIAYLKAELFMETP